MIRRLGIIQLLFRAFWFLTPALAFLISSTGLRAFAVIQPLSRDYLYLFLTLSLIWFIGCEHFRVTDVTGLFLDSNGMQQCFKALAWTYMSGFTLMFFYRGVTFSRLLLSSSAIVMLGEILLMRFVLKNVVTFTGALGRNLRIVIIGVDSFAQETSRQLADSRVAPCKTVAFVRLPGQEHIVLEDVPVFDVDQLMQRSLENFADDIVIGVTPESLSGLSGLVKQLRKHAIPIRLVMNFGPELIVREQLFRIAGTSMLDVQIAPSELMSYVIVKRCFDIAFSLLALSIVSLPMIVIAIAVKLSSPGPVLFKQERVSLNGKSFEMLKFRTMRIAPIGESGTRWTTPADARCTAVGSFLRKSSLDELPQFFNALRGDMSVVGPRPERPFFVEKFHEEIDAYNTRHHLKAGITGWAQVNGLRGDTDITRRLEMDLYYISNWSLGLDLRIILMTVFSGFFDKHAY
jgi:Undecaprenyl-phosphate glucose phosphotransferase